MHKSEDPAPEQLSWAAVVAHGTTKDDGKVGCLAPSELRTKLMELGVEEVLILACRAGCATIGAEMSRNGGPRVIAPTKVIDIRAAYIFALNYIWKRFGEGVSPAAAMGSANVAIPGDPYQLWFEGSGM